MDKRTSAPNSSGLDFTRKAEELIREIEEETYDLNADSVESIYSALIKKIKKLNFGDYLKRYIYDKANMTGNYLDIPLETFQSVIIESFKDNATDYSFYPTMAKREQLTRSWLERVIVDRDVVLLLGFGLKMEIGEINDFLSKALNEPMIDPKDTFEATCLYCYRMGYRFPHFKKLWNRYDPNILSVHINPHNLDSTVKFKERLDTIRDDEALLRYLYSLPVTNGSKRQSVTARKHFDRLYNQVKIGIARRKTETEEAEARILAERKADELSRSDQSYDYQKSEVINRIRSGAHVYTGDEISGSELESELFPLVPKNEKGNMYPMKESTLNDLFSGKRLNRQHISGILSGKDPITRYDLITLNFFEHDLSLAGEANTSLHYESFINSTNSILSECNMFNLYAANPYDCFILLCMKTECPIETFEEIWGMSYDA